MWLVALAEHLFESCIDRSEAAIVTDLKYFRSRLRLLKHFLSIRYVGCERLFTKDVLARSDSSNGEWHVFGVWCGDVDCVAGINHLFSGFAQVGSVRSCKSLSVRWHNIVHEGQLHTFIVCENTGMN